MPIVECYICGKEIERPQWQIDKSKHSICSRECMAEYHKQLFSKKVTLTCDNCGEEFERSPSLIKKNNRHYFCGKKCESEFRRQETIIKKLKLIHTECAWCGQQFWQLPNEFNRSQYQFCNKQCLDAWIKDVEGSSDNEYKIIIKCANCGQEIEKWITETKRSKYLFCNPECRKQFLKGRWASNWVDGSSGRKYPKEWTKTLREQVRDRDNRQCQICLKLESEISKKLQVHHIDGNKNNCDEDNLISLCAACHIKVERGHGR